MKQRNLLFFVALAGLATFIWMRDRAWITAIEDVLPAFAALPSLIWLGAPWRLLDSKVPVLAGWASSGIILLFVGLTLSLTVAMALAWTCFFWSVLRPMLAEGDARRIFRLLPLAFLAFPWIILDGDAVGWGFRNSGAWAAGRTFSILGCDVVQQGTELSLDGVGLEVTAACSGINTLQSMMVAGTILAYILLGTTQLYWLCLPMLVGLAWLANSARIFVIGVLALIGGPDLAKGFFHDWGGWLVLVLMFVICWGIFQLLAVLSKPAMKVSR